MFVNELGDWLRDKLNLDSELDVIINMTTLVTKSGGMPTIRADGFPIH